MTTSKSNYQNVDIYKKICQEIWHSPFMLQPPPPQASKGVSRAHRARSVTGVSLRISPKTGVSEDTPETLRAGGGGAGETPVAGRGGGVATFMGLSLPNSKPTQSQIYPEGQECLRNTSFFL